MCWYVYIMYVLLRSWYMIVSEWFVIFLLPPILSLLFSIRKGLSQYQSNNKQKKFGNELRFQMVCSSAMLSICSVMMCRQCRSSWISILYVRYTQSTTTTNSFVVVGLGEAARSETSKSITACVSFCIKKRKNLKPKKVRGRRRITDRKRTPLPAGHYAFRRQSEDWRIFLRQKHARLCCQKFFFVSRLTFFIAVPKPPEDKKVRRKRLESLISTFPC